LSDSERTPIRKAVIPAAGLGTRLKPLTSIAPKEMLPLGKKPALQYIMEDLQASGINDIIFVVSPQKTRIREYFGDSVFEGSVRLQYVIQDPQRGLADAILQAEEAVNGEPFAVALGDSVIISTEQKTPMERLLNAYRSNPASAAITVERVPREDCVRYGMVKPAGEMVDHAFEIDDLIEKPRVEDAPSDYAIGGRYIFDSGIFDCIRRTPPGFGGEHQITDSIRLMIADGKRVWCAPLLDGERRYDIGNFKTYSEAFTTICLQDPELAPFVLRAVGAAGTNK